VIPGLMEDFGHVFKEYMGVEYAVVTEVKGDQLVTNLHPNDVIHYTNMEYYTPPYSPYNDVPVVIKFNHFLSYDIVNNTPYPNERVEMSMDNIPLGSYNSVIEGLIHLLEQEMGESIKVVHNYGSKKK